MQVLGIDHVQLGIPRGGEERARAFYRDILGLPERAKPPELVGRGGCWFETDRVKIHLGVDPDFRPATKAHPGLLVSDLHGIVERCRQAGLEAKVEGSPLEGYRRAFLHDPFGNRLELMQRERLEALE